MTRRRRAAIRRPSLPRANSGLGGRHRTRRRSNGVRRLGRSLPRGPESQTLHLAV